MFKDFDGWNKKKKEVDQKKERAFFKEGEIWWANLGLNIGVEIDGKGTAFTRPVIIIKKYNQFSFLGIPLSTSKKLHYSRFFIGLIAGKEAAANIFQVRSLDSLRLENKIGQISSDFLNELKEKASQVNFG